jgi:hypothetical protein
MVWDVKRQLAARRSRFLGRPRAAGRPLGGGHTLPKRGVALLASLAALPVLAGCGSTLEAAPAAHVAAADPPPPSVPASCANAALGTLTGVLERVYREGVLSERTASAEYLITSSDALRAAVDSGDRGAARAAVHALLATGHMTDVTVMRGGRTFVAVGGPALAPLHGTLTGAGGAPIASYTASVWADTGFLTEAGGITQGLVALREGAHSVDGSPGLPGGVLPVQGALTRAGVAYRYTSFPVSAYPAGSLRVYLLMPTRTLAPLCGPTPQDTTVNALRRVAELIYSAEIGRNAQQQVRRVQRNKALLEAVAHREPEAARLAIDALLNEHIVRLRVETGGQLLSDVGGPYVLAPVTAPLRLAGHTIGSLTLSIQDDEGYLRLTKRLAGLDVLMYMDPAHPQLVKDSLGPGPGPALSAVPAEGDYRYEGRGFRVFTVDAEAFPTGPLVVRVLVPLPYPGPPAGSAAGRH